MPASPQDSRTLLRLPCHRAGRTCQAPPPLIWVWTRPDGGIGRRRGLKIPRPKGCEGSTPSPGTTGILEKTPFIHPWRELFFLMQASTHCRGAAAIPRSGKAGRRKSAQHLAATISGASANHGAKPTIGPDRNSAVGKQNSVDRRKTFKRRKRTPSDTRPHRSRPYEGGWEAPGEFFANPEDSHTSPGPATARQPLKNTTLMMTCWTSASQNIRARLGNRDYAATEEGGSPSCAWYSAGCG